MANLQTKHLISSNPYYAQTINAIKKNNNEVTFFVDGKGSASTWGHSVMGYLPINAVSISDNLKNWIEEQIWKLDRLLNITFKKVDNFKDAILTVVHTNEDLPGMGSGSYGASSSMYSSYSYPGNPDNADRFDKYDASLEIAIQTSSINHSDNFHEYALIHEIGHALTLEHPFEDNDGDVYGDVNTTKGEDTVLAYGSRTGTYPTWYQDIDIQAFQEIWGVEQPRIFESNFRDYNFYKIDNGYGIKLKEGTNTIDEITGIENLKFTDQ